MTLLGGRSARQPLFEQASIANMMGAAFGCLCIIT